MKIFVFGSNLAGIHGAGAAKFAHEHRGARWGNGHGLQGSSYAIPTKDAKVKTLHLTTVKQYIDEFIEDAKYYQKTDDNIVFQVTAIGCGLAEFKHNQIAPLFSRAPDNCVFSSKWINQEALYVGWYRKFFLDRFR